jgi:hypothetical protein
VASVQSGLQYGCKRRSSEKTKRTSIYTADTNSAASREQRLLLQASADSGEPIFEVHSTNSHKKKKSIRETVDNVRVGFANGE